MKIRPAAVAGTFYPDAPATLRHQLETMLAAARHEWLERQPKVLIVPHAGYIYSGPVAASGYALLDANRVSRVVLLGPTHRVPVYGLALPDCDAFATPLGQIPLDREAISSITGMPQVVISSEAHAWEHSLEVHLPFLQMTLEQFSLIPLAVGQASSSDVAEVLERLWGGPETLIVISSDLSHYLPYEQAREVDRASIDTIVQRREEVDHEQACGATPINGILQLAKRRRLTATLVDYRNSGDTAGDKERVVGYAAIALIEADSDET